MKFFLKRLIGKAYSIAYKKDEYILKNVFNKQFSRKVLVSFITAPFVSGLSDRHTNLLECYTACEIFDDLGFIVDVINYNEYSLSINYKEYSCVYGFGESFEKLFYWDEYNENINNIKKIIYATGCDTVFSNKESLRRVDEFYEKEKLFCINSARVVNSSWRCQIVFADLIIALGNNFVENTYADYNINEVTSIKIFYKNIGNLNIKNKNFSKARTNFIWWGSAGAIHKGLDLVISVFMLYPDCNLFICGLYEEHPFSQYVIEKKAIHSNIKDLGFVKVGSEQHIYLLMNCVATLLPSVSEGGAPGIVNACSAIGLIPIMTKACGVDAPEVVNQFLLDDANETTLIEALNRIKSLSDDELFQISVDIQKYFKYNHDYDSYKNRLRELISKVISSE